METVIKLVDRARGRKIEAMYGNIYSIETQHGSFANVFVNPTNNCQISSVASFENVLGFSDSEVANILAEIRLNTGKKLILVDVYRRYKDRATRIVGASNVVMSADYTNTYHDHQMTMMILNIDGFKSKKVNPF
jgi:hypothetical protein